jgi:thymidylate synthase (FAD)
MSGGSTIFPFEVCISVKHNLKVLDQGFVRVYEDGVYGSDLTIVNSARVSFGKRVSSFSDNDRKLMRYLAQNKHYSPFRHVSIQFHICMPEPCARQHYKHVVGIETTSAHPTKDHAWNEISGRYVKVSRFHRPIEFRAQSEDNKQASEGLIADQAKAMTVYENAVIATTTAYQELLDLGVAKEQARMVLPMAQYTEFYWTASFQALANFLELRDHSHAQWEIRQYAKAISTIVQSEFPEAYKAWFSPE